MFSNVFQRYSQFWDCEQLAIVDLVGGVRKTVLSLHTISSMAEMITSEINRINQILPNKYADEKTNERIQWMELVLDKMDHYKAEQYRYVKEGITLLELALWKAKLGEKEEYARRRGKQRSPRLILKVHEDKRHMCC